MDNRFLGLIIVFAPLSLLSFGGGQAIVADIQHQTVDIQHWLTDQEFTDMYAVSRASPGPSTLVAALIGWQVYGLLGAIIATLAIYIPSSIGVYFAINWWHRHEDSPWRKAIERGLGPIALGLIFAGVVAVLDAAHIAELPSADHPAHIDILGTVTTVVAATVLYATKVSPYLLVAVVALFYGSLQLF
jgi:chromate transporter